MTPEFPTLAALEAAVPDCTRCLRLAAYTRAVGETKVRRHQHETYWARPVPAWGDPQARVLAVGLAPAAHGANRTGRMFTGDDPSGEGKTWFYAGLYEAGFANQPNAPHRDDSLVLTDLWVTASARCAPPDNKPTRDELLTCNDYLRETLRLLPTVQVVVTLGQIATEAYCRAANRPKVAFAHHRHHPATDGLPHLITSYHPSRQNTQTGRLPWLDWVRVWLHARDLLV